MSGGAFLIGKWRPGRLPPPPPPATAAAATARHRRGCAARQLQSQDDAAAPQHGSAAGPRARPLKAALRRAAAGHSRRRARATHADQSAGSGPPSQPAADQHQQRPCPAQQRPDSPTSASSPARDVGEWTERPQGQFMTLRCSWPR